MCIVHHLVYLFPTSRGRFPVEAIAVEPIFSMGRLSIRSSSDPDCFLDLQAIVKDLQMTAGT